MIALDWVRLRDAVNADAEFRLAARHWTAVVGLEMGEKAVLFRVKDGELQQVAPGEATAASIRMGASDSGWLEFFQPVPKPFYQGILPAIARQGFTLDGDIETWTVYYGAMQRIFTLMRQMLNTGETHGSV